MMFSSLRARLWLSYALVVFTALGITATILIIYILRSPLAQRQILADLKAVNTVIVSNGLEPLASLPDGSLQEIAERYDLDFDVRVLIISSSRTLLADSRRDALPMLSLESVRYLLGAQAAKDEAGGTWLISVQRLSERRWLVLAAPRPKITILGLIRNDLFLPFCEAGALAFLLSLLAAYSLSRWIGNPLQRMLEAARAFPNSGKQPIRVEGPHEVKDLARAFNDMTSRVHASQASQREFVANVSHELKTPLTSIQGFAQAMLDGTADTPEARQQAAAVIHNEAGRMHRMALDLLDLARLDAGTLDLEQAEIDLPALLNTIAEKLTPQAHLGQVTLRIEKSAIPPVAGDGDRLAQVITILVDNALKFTPAGGLVTLSAKHAAGQVLIEVCDTGSGVPDEAIPHIFDRFYQVDSSRRGGEKHGAGLGLAIAHEIVLAHGGTISVRNNPAGAGNVHGSGCTFTVSLPCPDPDAPTIVSKRRP